MRLRHVMPVFPVALAALALATAVPAGAIPSSSASFGATGSPQALVVPSGVVGVTAELSGAGGGQGYDAADEALTGGATGGWVVATLATTPGSTLEVTVGGAGGDGSSESSGSGGYNGGGDGSYDGETGAGGGGGGGATDIRSGSCATSLDCPTADRAVVAGGGGGAAGGDGYAPGGGDGGGGTGGTGGNPDCTTGGGGGTQSGPGAAGVVSPPDDCLEGIASGNPGTGSVGGAASGDGGGGGGGYFGGGGGGELYASNGSGGGGGSGYLAAGSTGESLVGEGAEGSTDGSATIYWAAATTLSTTAGGSVTITAYLPSTLPEGSTETFTVGSTVLCSAVAVVDGLASCTTSALPVGSDEVTATLAELALASFTVGGSVFLASHLAGRASGESVRLDATGGPWSGTTEVLAVTVSAVPVPASGAGIPAGVPPVAVILLLAGGAGILTTRRRRSAR